MADAVESEAASSCTVAPGSGWPVSSTTRPLIEAAQTGIMVEQHRAIGSRVVFFINIEKLPVKSDSPHVCEPSSEK